MFLCFTQTSPFYSCLSLCMSLAVTGTVFYLPNPCAQHRVWVHVQTGGASAWMLEMRNFFCCQERPAGDIIFESLSELPARSVDLSALNLTELVNGMLNRALKGNHFFFFFLSTIQVHFCFLPASLLDFPWPGQDPSYFCISQLPRVLSGGCVSYLTLDEIENIQMK